MPQDLADDKWTLVQVMAWCRQCIPLQNIYKNTNHRNEVLLLQTKNALCSLVTIYDRYPGIQICGVFKVVSLRASICEGI